MFSFIKNLIAKETPQEVGAACSRQIDNKSLDEVEVALQRTFSNKRLETGQWKIQSGSTKNIKTQRQVIYQFKSDVQGSGLLLMRIQLKKNAYGVLLSWSLSKEVSASKSASDKAIDELISKSTEAINELIDGANG